jgi:hypothetical protein
MKKPITTQAPHQTDCNNVCLPLRFYLTCSCCFPKSWNFYGLMALSCSRPCLYINTNSARRALNRACRNGILVFTLNCCVILFTQIWNAWILSINSWKSIHKWRNNAYLGSILSISVLFFTSNFFWFVNDARSHLLLRTKNLSLGVHYAMEYLFFILKTRNLYANESSKGAYVCHV